MSHDLQTHYKTSRSGPQTGGGTEPSRPGPQHRGGTGPRQHNISEQGEARTGSQ